MALSLSVDENVLIPRPETELLIEHVLDVVKSKKSKVKSILDIGTGSGAIILALANGLNSITLSSSASQNKYDKLTGDLDSRLSGNDKEKSPSFFASDVSDKALAVAKKNAKNLGFENDITFKLGSLFDPWDGQKFDLIVTNLPYVPHEDMATLALDLIHYEPRLALDGGAEGLEIYEKFFDQVSTHLNDGGTVYCEIGYDQGDKIIKYLQNVMPKAKVTVIGDYADIDRIVIIET